MATQRQLKKRIKSVKSTKQVTKAMELVSASKIRKSQMMAVQAEPYAYELSNIAKSISNVSDISSSFFRKAKKVKNICVLVIGPSRGFVGSLTSNLTSKLLTETTLLKTKYPNVNLSCVSINKLGLKISSYLEIPNLFHLANLSERPSTTELSPLYKFILDKFENKEFDEVYIGYMHFINILKQEPKFTKILPIKIEDVLGTEKVENQEMNFIFEPDISQVLNFLLPEYFETQILASLLESNASENAARMISMRNATDNADELSKELILKYNKTRQTSITTQILEVASNA